MEKDFLPIVAPIGLDENFVTYNINADDAACAIAKAMGADKLAFLTDIEGVYKDPKDPSTFISRLTVSEANEMVEKGYIGGGKIACHICKVRKVDNDCKLRKRIFAHRKSFGGLFKGRCTGKRKGS